MLYVDFKVDETSSRLCICVAGAIAKLGKELGFQFHAVKVMDAFRIVYPQYWSERNAIANFNRHMKFFKTHYGHGKLFSTASFLEGSLDPVLSLANLYM
jgi:hypothetical protein